MNLLNVLLDKFNQLDEENKYILLAEASELLTVQQLKEKHRSNIIKIKNDIKNNK